MIDITTTRTESMKMHPPVIIFTMLCTLSLVASLFAGYGMAGGRTRRWIHQVGFPLVMAATVYVITDIEYPRMGLIQLKGVDKVLVDLRESMNASAP